MSNFNPSFYAQRFGMMPGQPGFDSRWNIQTGGASRFSNGTTGNFTQNTGRNTWQVAAGNQTNLLRQNTSGANGIQNGNRNGFLGVGGDNFIHQGRGDASWNRAKIAEGGTPTDKGNTIWQRGINNLAANDSKNGTSFWQGGLDAKTTNTATGSKNPATTDNFKQVGLQNTITTRGANANATQVAKPGGQNVFNNQSGTGTTRLSQTVDKGSSTANTGSGNDTVRFNGSGSQLTGNTGAGNDTLNVTGRNNSGYLNGGTGSDTLQLSPRQSGLTIDGGGNGVGEINTAKWLTHTGLGYDKDKGFYTFDNSGGQTTGSPDNQTWVKNIQQHEFPNGEKLTHEQFAQRFGMNHDGSPLTRPTPGTGEVPPVGGTPSGGSAAASPLPSLDETMASTGFVKVDPAPTGGAGSGGGQPNLDEIMTSTGFEKVDPAPTGGAGSGGGQPNLDEIMTSTGFEKVDPAPTGGGGGDAGSTPAPVDPPVPNPNPGTPTEGC